MIIQTAISRISKSASKLDAAYGPTVFDELAIIGLDEGKLHLHYYKGPNEAGFRLVSYPEIEAVAVD